ncbi:hypothetical protein [Parapedobacter pyrenivorans]|uniref:hypothetical protein n=1 Tax=Parapedobacter pyrenivorans TaxID=1305674 RepID=UPI003342151B
METTTVRYEKLFSILLTHVDFPSPSDGDSWRAILSNEMAIEPDEPTKKLFATHEIKYRFTYNTLSCYIRVETATDRPFHRLPTNFSARFIFHASGALIARSALSPELGGTNTYHVRVKLKTTTSSANLQNGLLTGVVSAIPDVVFQPGYGDQPGQWVNYPVSISGCMAVLDILTEGSGKNRLYKQEASQLLNYTVANGKSDQHLYRIILKA